MFSVATTAAYPALREWEETGILLHKTLSRYLELSISLGKSSLSDGTPPAYLAPRIESTLESLHLTLEQQLTESRSALSQTRNQLISPIYRLPEEVLSHIIMLVVSSLNAPLSKDKWSMNQRLLERYRSLGGILGVCRVWRSVALDQGSLWSLIPGLEHYEESNMGQAIKRITERSKGAYLTLCAVDGGPMIRQAILAHACRFRAVDIVTGSAYTINNIVDMFADQHPPERSMITKLSLHRESNSFDRLPEEDDYVLSRESHDGLFRQLSVLQLRGAPLRGNAFATAERLTTFHLQDTMLGYDPAVLYLLKALSSATQLRELKLINVKTYQDSSPNNGLLVSSVTWPPNLQSLIIKDLYFNTWRLILSSIKSRTLRLSFVFTRKSRRSISDGGGDVAVEMPAVCEALSRTPIRALLLDSEYWYSSDPMFSPGELEMMLEVIPSLETLWMNRWEISEEFCRALHRPRKQQNNNSHSLANMYFTSVGFSSPESFKEMAQSYAHSLHQVALERWSGQIDHEVEMWFKAQEIAGWLQVSVPEFKVINSDFVPPEFRNISWQEVW